MNTSFYKFEGIKKKKKTLLIIEYTFVFVYSRFHRFLKLLYCSVNQVSKIIIIRPKYQIKLMFRSWKCLKYIMEKWLGRASANRGGSWSNQNLRSEMEKKYVISVAELCEHPNWIFIIVSMPTPDEFRMLCLKMLCSIWSLTFSLTSKLWKIIFVNSIFLSMNSYYCLYK